MFTGRSGLHVYGVRHHSPACARLVSEAIRTLRPRHVLIEGPADLNDRLDELLLEHELPIAIFSSYRDGPLTRASWTPFCAYSPEWVALREGHAAGAQVRFMDLPAWDPVFHGVENRYADRRTRRGDAIDALCARFSVEGLDALWDHLFELQDSPATLPARLRTFFEALRADEPPTPEDLARESFMQAQIEAALADGGPVLVVCGGYHAPALAQSVPAATSSFPSPPRADAATSHLVPYSFRRLDAFTGYASGMPSPAYYQAVWELGPDAAADHMLRQAVEAVRRRGQHVSAADLIAARSISEGLARLRGHAVQARTDLLDGLAAALVKEALDAPLPWSRRGPLSVDTDPLLAEVLRAFSGDRRGRLDERTPRPPLLDDVERTLRAHGLLPTSAPRRLTLSLQDEEARGRSRVLHRLRALGIPGFRAERSPTFPTDPVLDEHWTITQDENLSASVMEASGYGATLEQAATARFEELLQDPTLGVAALAVLLSGTLFAGVDALHGSVLARIAARAGEEPDLREVGAAIGRLLGMWRHDVLLGGRDSSQLGAVVAALFDRGLWLLEYQEGPTLPADDGHVQAVVSIRDALRHAGASLRLDDLAATAVFRRRLEHPRTPPAIRGACLGALWALASGDGGITEEAALGAIRAAALPTTLGDFLVGLFCSAREQVVHAPSIPQLLDEVIRGMDEGEFLRALPSLRLAFSYFPPAEKAEIARAILPLHGRASQDAAPLLRKLAVAPEVTVRGARMDADVDQILARHGLKREVTDAA